MNTNINNKRRVFVDKDRDKKKRVLHVRITCDMTLEFFFACVGRAEGGGGGFYFYLIKYYLKVYNSSR